MPVHAATVLPLAKHALSSAEGVEADWAGHRYPTPQGSGAGEPPPGQADRAGQLAQVPAPPKLYSPGGHSTAVALVEPAGQAYPAVHSPLQVSADAATAAPNRPAGHGAVQAAEASPLVFPNTPTGQLLHTP